MTTQDQTEDAAAAAAAHADTESGPSRVSSMDIDPPTLAKRSISIGHSGAGAVGIVPQTLDELSAYASWIISAGMVPKGIDVDPFKLDLQQFPGPSQDQKAQQRITTADKMTKARVMIVIEKGLEIGMMPITALSTIMIVNNRPCVWGDGGMALIQQHRVLAKQEVVWSGTAITDAWTCVVRLWRVGNPSPFEGTFTYKTAKTARLLAKKGSVWLTYPERMMFNRARAFAQRDGFADCLMGLGIAEEVQDIQNETEATAASPKDFLDDGPAAVTAPDAGQTAITHEPGVTIDMKPTPQPEPVEVKPEAQRAEEPIADDRGDPEIHDGEFPNTDGDVSATGDNISVSPEDRQEPAPETPKEPTYKITKKNIGDYARDLIAWIPYATDADLERHMKSPSVKNAMEFIRENRSVDWEHYNIALEDRRMANMSKSDGGR